ncbi:hypothetical protein BD410DRAFT_487816 [Rickenella mellea]|uniref:DUF6534 domain-containing protein n=1 Tax=Rickenella mellea TaxID=50990 RepID=A0A4Y7QHN5_9AGAM|nr:hypothetical protein BD410DRAFT_487816 [Rickenella mellea]
MCVAKHHPILLSMRSQLENLALQNQKLYGHMHVNDSTTVKSQSFIFATMLYGVLCSQIYNYYVSFGSDGHATKLIVGILLFLNTVGIAMQSDAMYYYLIQNFSNITAISHANWTINLQGFINALVTSICQFFFAWRVWRVSRGSYFLTGAIVASSCVQLGKFTDKGIRVTNSMNTIPISMNLGSSLLCDLLISFSCCFYLAKNRTGFQRMDNVINSLMLYSVCTGIVTSTVAIAVLILFFTMKTTLFHVGVGFLVGKLYSNSLMANLNSRYMFRRELSTEGSVQLTTMPTLHRQREKPQGPMPIYATPNGQV